MAVDVGVLSESQVVESCLKLLPRGVAWPVEGGGWSQWIAGFAPEVVRLQQRIDDLLRESDPRTCNKTLGRWERDRGLPDDCSIGVTLLVERRNILVGRVVQIGNQRAARFIAIANNLGYAMTVTTYDPGDTVPGHPEIAVADAAFVMQFNLPEGAIVSEFYAGDGVAGDPLDAYETPDRVICEIERVLHQHMIPIYTLGLI